jgi:DNA polymerase bacteriophage-type
MTFPPPPNPEYYRIGQRLIAGESHSEIIADFDFETRSSAGFVWCEYTNKFQSLRGAREKGLKAIGTPAYTEHESAEVICLAYNLKDGFGARQWQPGQPNPLDLFIYLENGGLIEAWNVSFEYYVWTNICMRKYLFPPLPINQLRCAAAKSRAYSLPSSLDECGKILNIKNKKLTEGKRLITRYSQPHNPTNKNPTHWHDLKSNPQDHRLMMQYNLLDIRAEAEISNQVPDLSIDELAFWQADQAINRRGVQLDIISAQACVKIVEAAFKKYQAQLVEITNGAVTSVGQIARIMTWMREYGISTPNLDDQRINELLNTDLPDNVAKVLKIRKLIGSAAVKKLYAMLNRVSGDGRIRESFVYHRARTGRAGGAGIQPQNFPNSAKLTVDKCACGHYHKHSILECPWCGTENPFANLKKIEWNSGAVEDALAIIASGSLSAVQHFFGDALETIAGCLRGLLIAKDGHKLIGSDYSSIEGIVLAMIAQEQWHIDVYNSHGMMYEMTAAKITNTPFEEFIRVKKETGKHHHLRRLGKVASLASGYQGHLGAWVRFGADEFLSEQEIKDSANAWRRANPMIVKLWHELQSASHMAVNNPGHLFIYNGIVYIYRKNIDVLFCKLLSGRSIVYHKPRLSVDEKRGGFQLSYEGWNDDPKKGKMGWIRMFTYGGSLTENVCQAISRDILAHAIVNLERRSMPVVLHVHDEIVCEIPKESLIGVKELENIMMQLPLWAKDWPIKATGGWSSNRYQK